MTGLWGRTIGAISAGGALIIMAGLAIPVATPTTAAAAVTAPAYGVDVSSIQHLNGAINWSDVASAGKAFAGIKASEGNYYTNPYFASDVQQATAAGVYVIPYAFANPSDPASNGTAQQQADTAAAMVNSVSAPAGLMLPLALDLEPDPYSQSQCYGLSTSAMRTWITDFITEADNKLNSTRPLIIYTETAWWNTCTGNDTAFGGKYPLWLASYGMTNPALPSGWHNYTLWQYSDQGTVNGISGAVDLDYLGPVVLASQVGSPIGAVQLSTLSSLAGQAVSYSSATGLPPGLTMSSSGQISGTPTTIGRYTATVTPSAGVPSTLTFTWDVHGSISVTSLGNRTTTAGSPVWVRLRATDQDGASYPPAFTVSGLPPGLSLGAYGIIHGWPYKPGTYRGTVYASDGLYAAGSASFTWTVSAAADSGATGTIRQWGGSSKCLDAAGYGKTNGTQIDLWGCTGHWNQNWTIVQDGTIRVGGKCLDVTGEGRTNGTRLQLWTCNSGDGAQQWLVDSDSQLFNPQSGKCLDVPSSNAPNGTRVEIYTCVNDTNEHWLRPAANIFSGDGGRCLAVSGSAAVLAGCANTGSQHWTESWNGNLQLGSRCLTEAGTAAGSDLTMGSCSRTGPVTWQLRPIGPVAVQLINRASGLCVTAPTSIIGVKLVIEPCAVTQAATWHVS